MNCFVSGPDDGDQQQITVGQQEVLRSCLQQLQLTSGAADLAICTIRATRFPDLPPLTFQ